jgi:hypothetical protein
MNTMQRNKIQRVARPVTLSIGMIAVIAVLAGCERAERTVDSAENQAHVDQPAGDEQPLGQVTEFDDFTLRANVSRTKLLPEAMARQYGIEREPDLVLLTLVVLENRPDPEVVPVSAEVSAQYESLIGHVEVIDMRAVEADGFVSYIGTLDASGQRFFRFVIEAQPAGTDQPLRMNFEVQLDALDIE